MAAAMMKGSIASPWGSQERAERAGLSVPGGAEPEVCDLGRGVDANGDGAEADAAVDVQPVPGTPVPVFDPPVRGRVALHDQLQPAPVRRPENAHLPSMGVGGDGERCLPRGDPTEGVGIVHEHDPRCARRHPVERLVSPRFTGPFGADPHQMEAAASARGCLIVARLWENDCFVVEDTDPSTLQRSADIRGNRFLLHVLLLVEPEIVVAEDGEGGDPRRRERPDDPDHAEDLFRGILAGLVDEVARDQDRGGPRLDQVAGRAPHRTEVGAPHPDLVVGHHGDTGVLPRHRQPRDPRRVLLGVDHPRLHQGSPNDKRGGHRADPDRGPLQSPRDGPPVHRPPPCARVRNSAGRRGGQVAGHRHQPGAPSAQAHPRICTVRGCWRVRPLTIRFSTLGVPLPTGCGCCLWRFVEVHAGKRRASIGRTEA